MAKILLFILVLVPLSLSAQTRRVLNLLEETEYAKAEEIINRGLEKDAEDAGLLYCYSLLYSKSDFLGYSLEESSRYASLSLRKFDLLEDDEKDDLLKTGIDSVVLRQQKSLADSLGFYQASEYNSVTKLDEYITQFEGSSFQKQAILLRDSLAFIDVTSRPYSADDLRSYIGQYPSSKQVSEARSLIDSLEYRSVMATGDKNELIALLESENDGSHRDEIEKRLFNLMTYRHDAESYLSYIEVVKSGKQVDRAIDYLYHITKSSFPKLRFTEVYPNLAVCDSLQVISEKESQYAIVIHSGEQPGFMNADGTTVFERQKGTVPDEYVCEAIEEDFLVTRDGENGMIYSRGGNLIYEGPFQEVYDEGNGLLAIEDKSKHTLIHKSGELLKEAEELMVLDTSIVAAMDGEKWSLFAVNGTPISSVSYDYIEEVGAFIVVENEERIAVSTPEALFRNMPNPPDLDFKYTDVELLEYDKLIVKDEGFEGLLNRELSYEVPFAYQQIISVKNGYLIESEGLFKAFLTNKGISDDEWYEQIAVNEQWIARRKLSKWSIENLRTGSSGPFEYDSVNLLSDHIVVGLSDSLDILFDYGSTITMEKETAIRLLSMNGSSNTRDFIWFKDPKEDLVVLSDSGKVIFRDEIDKISTLGDQYLLIEKDMKKGLLDKSGNLLLKFSYEAIGNYEEGAVTILKNRKFGLFDQNTNVMIPAEYDQRIERLNDEAFIVNKKKKWGLVDREGKALLEPEYDALEKWTGRYILAKTGDEWRFVDINTEEIVGDSLKSFEIISRNESETIMKSYNPGGYGIFSSTQGYIVPQEYTDVNNIGTTENPIYLAERFFSTADYYLLIYYNRNGNIIRKQGLEPEAYDQIYCD